MQENDEQADPPALPSPLAPPAEEAPPEEAPPGEAPPGEALGDEGEARAKARRAARDAQVADLLGELPSAEAAELRSLLGGLEARPKRLPSEEWVGDATRAAAAGVDREAKDRVAKGLLLAGAIVFVCAIVYGWGVGRSLPPALAAQKRWVEVGVLPGGPLPIPGQVIDSETLDPWEHHYRLAYRGAGTWRVHSSGPDGVDDGGGGDDVPLPGGWRWLLGVLAIYGEGMLGILGLVLIWLGAGIRVLWLPRSRDPRVENARAIGLLLVPALLTWLAARLFGAEFVAMLPQRFVVPGDFVLWGSVAALLGLGFYLIKAWRRANLPSA